MPASPRDFALWSSMTGNPYPQSDAERAALAPQVYQYVNNIGRKGGSRGLLDVVGKTALAAGAIAGAVALSRTPAGQQVIEEVSKTVGPHVQGVQKGVSNIAGQLLPESEGGAGEYAADLGRKIGGGAQSFLGGFKEGVRARAYPGSSQVEAPVEQVVEVSRPVTYGRGSRPVNTGRVTWGQGDIAAPSIATSIPDPWQERPRGVVVANLSKVQEQGMGGMPYETLENIQPGPGLVAQQLANEYASIDNDYANKAAAYRKSQQYAEMVARHPALQNIGPNEELVGGVTGATEVLPQEGPDVAMDIINRYAPDYRRAKGAEYGREAQGELQRQAAYAGSIESRIDDLLANIRGGPQGHETTTERYNQEVIPAQMRLEQEAKGAPPGAPARRLLQNEPVTQAERLSTQQTMEPSSLAAPGPSQQEISDMDMLLLRSHGHLSPDQRAALRNDVLFQQSGGQSDVIPLPAEVGPSAPVVVAAVNPVAKANRWRQARAEMDENARIGRLGGYGYDLYQPVEPTAMQEAPGSQQELIAEQMKRNAMLQAEIPGHIAYAAQKRQAVPSTPYNPQEFRSFIKPASVWMGG
jgi:hypothetical protein